MTLKELLGKEKEINQKACEAIAKYLQPIEDELFRVRKEIIEKVTEPTKVALTNGGKDAGTVNFNLEGVQVKAIVAKTVRWDQKGLAEMAKKIEASGDNPNDYVEAKTTFNIPETKYKNFPEWARNAFLPFREVKTGPPKYEYTIPEAKELPDA